MKESNLLKGLTLASLLGASLVAPTFVMTVHAEEGKTVKNEEKKEEASCSKKDKEASCSKKDEHKDDHKEGSCGHGSCGKK